MLRPKAHLVHDLHGDIHPFLLGADAVDFQGLHENVAHLLFGVQTGVGILEDHLDLPAHIGDLFVL